MAGWNPIETAPTDTPVLVYWPLVTRRPGLALSIDARQRPDILVAEQTSTGFWSADGVGPEENDEARYGGDGPKFWLPLPEDPPTETAGRAE